MNEEINRMIPFDPKAWEFELRAWINRLGAVPTMLMRSVDLSEPCLKRRAHVFKVHAAKYALITEMGCSCYTEEDARVYLYPRFAEAARDFDSWKKAQQQQDWFEPTGILQP